MKMQLALDTTSLEQAVEIVGQVKEYIEIIEIGTPMIIGYGMEAVRVMKKNYPEILVLADTKIMDGGAFEAKMVFDAGADILTVLAVSNDETIFDVVNEAKKAGKKVMADMMCVNDISKRGKTVLEIGVDYVCAHTAVDIQKKNITPYEELSKLIDTVGKEKCAVAGGINLENIQNIIKYQPGIFVVGNGIIGKDNRNEEARNIFEKVNV